MQFSRHKPSILELGGGTGVLGEMLQKKGFPYVGFDRSFGMCREAKMREVPLFCADACALPVKKQFDLAVFLYDGINYLPNLVDYEQLFAEVYDVLTPGGCFLFDITTESNSLQHFTQFLDFEDWEDYSYVRKSYYRKITQEQFNDFTIYRQLKPNEPHFERYFERHCQKLYPFSAVERTIDPELFTVVGVWDCYSSNRATVHSERVHFLLKKVGD